MQVQKTSCVGHENWSFGRCKKRSRSPAGLRHRRKRTHAYGVCPLPPACLALNGKGSTNGSTQRWKWSPVFRRVSLCVRFFSESRVYTRFREWKRTWGICERSWKSRWEVVFQRVCHGNVLTIFVEVVLSENPNFTGGFFEWRRPFENITG